MGKLWILNTTRKKFTPPALTMDYFKVPWDTEILKRPVAEIKNIEVREPVRAQEDMLEYTIWCKENAITFCNCRIAHNQVKESIFLQTRGFMFIELNYHPEINGLQNLKLPEDEIRIERAVDDDKLPLAEMAGSVFKHGRFHQDPRIGEIEGNRRYSIWLLNAFEMPHQHVFKYLLEQKVIGFFVVEYPQKTTCLWSLIGLAPEFQGKELGKRVWLSMIGKHQREGIETITTSISSHNIAVMNLYVSLGFRFPVPHATFHWHAKTGTC